MAGIYDHITDSNDDDEVWTSLCGMKETDLPEAPLCPYCEEMEKRTRGSTWLMPGVQFRGNAEQPSFFRAYGLHAGINLAVFGLGLVLGLPAWCFWVVLGASLMLWLGVVLSRVDIRKVILPR